MRFKILVIFAFLIAIQIDLKAQRPFDNRVIGIFSQQLFYRFTIIEFKKDMIFDYHIMSERAHKKTRGSYVVIGDTIILNSSSIESDFDFKNEKWLILSHKKILISDNYSNKKKIWAILIRDKKYNYVPEKESDFACKIDSIKINALSWTKDTTNYDSELKLIFHEPLPPKEPVLVLDGVPVKYGFLLNYYNLDDIQSLIYTTGDKLIKSGIHGGQAENGLIIVTTKKNKPKR